MAEQIKVGVDTGDSQQQLEDMAKAVNAFTREVGKASGKQIRLLDVTSDIAELKELMQNWREVVNAAPTIRGAISSANVNAGRPAAERPATPMQLDRSLRDNQRWMQSTMVRLMTHNASQSANPASTGLSYHDYTGRFQDATSNPAPANRPQNDSRFSKVAQQAVQGFGSGGVVGGTVASFARGAGQASESGLGAMGILKGGGVAALGYAAFQAVSAGVGAVSDKMDSGKQENIEVDKFRRSLGSTADSFSDLKNQSRAVGEQFNLTYEQSRKLTVEFAGLAKVNAPGQAGVGIDLARSTGVDESQGVGFMATMRRIGSLSEKTADAKLLSIQFAEALKRTGSTLNAGDLMGAMGSFASSTAQRSLSAPNVDGFASLLSSMVGSNVPGLKNNVGNAANILNNADASFRSGGGMGEASTNLHWRALGGDKIGLMGFKMLQEGGLFGTSKGILENPDSEVLKYVGKDRFKGKGDSIASLTKIIDFYKNSGADRESQIGAASNDFKMGREATAYLFNQGPEKLNSLTGLFDKHKVDATKLSAFALSSMADIGAANVNGGALSSVRDKMLAREGLTDDQRASLTKTKSMQPANLEAALVEIAKTFEREKNLGEQAQVTAAKIEQSTARMADMLIPAATASKDLLSDLLSWMAPESAQGKQRIEAGKRAERDAFGTNAAAMADRNAFYDRQRKIVGDDPAELARLDAAQKDEMGSYAKAVIQVPLADDPRRFDAGKNNFGNLRSGKNGAFGSYATPEDGIAATDANLRAYGSKHGIDTLGGVIRRWAPPNENNTNAYISNASKWTGLGPNDRINLGDQATRKKIAYAIFKQEGRMPRDQLEQFKAAQLPAGHSGDRSAQAQQAAQTLGSATANIVVRVETADGLKAQAPSYPTSMVFKPSAAGGPKPWQSLVQ